MDVKIALLAGDGIGPEIVAEATKVLDRVAEKFGHKIEYRPALVGAAAIDAVGDPYPDETHAVCLAADAVLFGAIGDPKYDNDPTAKVRPEQGLLRMRKSLGLFANLRPVALFDALADRSPLRAEVVRGTDFICVRELTGGIYFGRPQGRDDDGQTRLRHLHLYRRGDRTGSARGVPAGRCRAAASSRSWTRPTCSKPRVCGVRRPSASPRSTPRWRWTICSWTTPPCRSSTSRPGSMSS